MKKIFSIVMAVAVVGLSFTACKKKGQNEPTPEPEKKVTFKIEVSNVLANSADIAVNPSDTTAFYVLAAVPSEKVAEWGKAAVDSIVGDELIEYIKKYGAETMYEYEYLEKGNVKYVFSVEPETDYTVYAIHIDTAQVDNMIGNYATKAFTTPKLEATETIEVGEVAGSLQDYTGVIGTFMVISDAINEAGESIMLTIDADAVDGNFTEDDFNAEYVSGIIKADGFSLFATATLTGETTTAGYVIGGEGLAGDGKLYKFSIVCPLEDDDDAAGAPAKVAARKDAKGIKYARIRKEIK